MTGKYRQWISNQEVQEFILLDFRRSIPKKQRGMHFLYLLSLHPPPSFLTAYLIHFLSNVGIDWLSHVVFADNFSSYTVYDCKAVPGESQIALLQWLKMLVLSKLLYVLTMFISISDVRLPQLRWPAGCSRVHNCSFIDLYQFLSLTPSVPS